ncbi:hypothetical protein ACWOAH_10355 [Vagococcus vulneris]|uniref:Uncharacterized protein n=1 Tax=Vagococcus vulneris TaxID=1977869 RepID=A0A429ZTB0_9ENTE|nr:hypothetical protein [Vagococcus vulneris]RST96967.1 hypothetical protein CBF37_10445 [Vagococcus vulneris]
MTEKVYYWRKRKGYSADFEDETKLYLNMDLVSERLFLEDKVEGWASAFKTTFTEREAEKILGDKIFLFEKVI